MPLWIHCTVIIKLKVERYRTIVKLQNTKFKEKKDESKKKRRQTFRQQADRTLVASVIDKRDNHYTTPNGDSIGENKISV